MHDRKIFVAFIVVILAMLAIAMWLIRLPNLANLEVVPTAGYIGKTSAALPFFLDDEHPVGIYGHLDDPCLIATFSAGGRSREELDRRYREIAAAAKWTAVDAAEGSWRFTRVATDPEDPTGKTGAEELRLRHEADRDRVVLGWFRREGSAASLDDTSAAEFLRTRFWPIFERPDEPWRKD
ncbi:MAG: hypothetical protein R3F20_00455 [Planctomycetota bacterium]